MVIVASNSYTITSLLDGSSPVVHQAWANSSDGVIDFSTTTNANRRYTGSYIDYLTANSTDPAKYKWTDMAGNATIGIRNYILGSDVTITTGSKDFTLSTDFVTTMNAQRQITISLTVNGSNMSDTITAGFWLTLNLTDSTSTTVSLVATTPKNYDPRINLTWKLPDGKYVSTIGRCWMEFPGTVPSNAKLQRPKIEFGNLPTGWIIAQEDTDATVNAKINTKADSTLTTAQLNALAERQYIADVQLQSKASADTVANWISAYQDFVSSNNADKLASQQALIDASNRIVSLQNSLGDTQERWSFLDNFMSASNDGLVLGNNNGSSSIKIKNDRISMFSGGNEVMYISQGVLNIANGVFTSTLQVGRYRMEQSSDNPDILLIRYVG